MSKKKQTKGEKIALAIALYIHELEQGPTLEKYLFAKMAREIDEALNEEV